MELFSSIKSDKLGVSPLPVLVSDGCAPSAPRPWTGSLVLPDDIASSVSDPLSFISHADSFSIHSSEFSSSYGRNDGGSFAEAYRATNDSSCMTGILVSVDFVT